MHWFHIVWTIVLLALFIGIVLWAWSAGRNKDFQEAAQLPLESDESYVIRPEHNRPAQEGANK